MAWNPSPKVADARAIARKWGRTQIIIIGLSEGQMEIATYGETKVECACAAKLGGLAYVAIRRQLEACFESLPGTESGAKPEAEAKR